MALNNNRQQQPAQNDEMSSALALAALSGGSMDPEIKDMLKILVGDALAKRQKEKDRMEKQLLSSAQASKEYHE
jgi:hypothetical protein